MVALPKDDQPEFPRPLEFFNEDFIHPDNQALMEREQKRWRLLSFVQRFRMTIYAASLARQLRRVRYLDQALNLVKLRRAYLKAKAQYQATTFIDDQAKAAAKAKLIKMAEEGNRIKGLLADYHATFELWQHYQGWLRYEAENRRDLLIEAKNEKRRLNEMRREARFLEHIIRDVWRHTDGCHHTYKARDKSGKEKTKVPGFERSIIKPDAHYFYLRTTLHIPIVNLYKWRLPDGVTTTRLQEDDVLENLRAATKRQVDALWTDQNQMIIRVSRLDSPDALPKLVKWRDAMKFYPKHRNSSLPYVIGATENRKFIWLDFLTDRMILIAGTQGSGKSNLINSIIATVVSTHSPREIRVIMLDLKGGMEASHWQELPHLLWNIVKTVDEVKPMLTRLLALMQQRMTSFAAVGAKTLDEYNLRVDADQRLEWVLIVMDELSMFVGLGQETEEIHNLMMKVVSLGRAVGVRVIECTQHPEVKVLPGRIKTNLDVRLCGWMPSVGASMIVLDNPEASRISKLAGRFALTRGMDTITIQCTQIDNEDIAGVVSAARVAYTDVSNDLHDAQEQLPTPKVWDEERIIRAALDITDGRLSADALHEMLGSESPGERTLRKLARGILDKFEAGLPITHEGKPLHIKRKGKAYYLHFLPHPVNSDAEPIPDESRQVSEPTSVSPESAAD